MNAENKFLSERSDRFAAIFKKEDLVCPLLAAVDIPITRMKSIEHASQTFLAAAMNLPNFLESNEILDIFYKKRESHINITPTGMILPKKHSSLEYNLLLRNYYNLVNEMYFSNALDDCHTPAHLRVKWSNVYLKDLKRPRHAPEEKHFDSWSGYSSHGLTFLLGIHGDIIGNRVKFYIPNKLYDEKWLQQKNKPSPELLDNCYELIDYIPSYGQLVIMDTCLLHQTFRESGCGTRLSMDNIFRLKKTMSFEEHIEPARQKELTKFEQLTKLGTDCFYFCSHDDTQRKDTLGGTIDPTELKFATRI